MSFEPNAILRGLQLTVVGAHRALLNPAFFKHHFYKQVVLFVAAGILIQLILSIPVLFLQGSLYFSSLFIDLERASWDDIIVDSIHFLQHSVLQLPLFLMTLLKYVNPSLDNMFMESLAWVDLTYVQKHQSQDASQLRGMYHDNLKQYNSKTQPAPETKRVEAYKHGVVAFLNRSSKKAAISITLYLLTFLPYVGKLVLPIFSFYSLVNLIGPKPAVGIFAMGLVIPKTYFVMFLQAFFSSRSMMRELLEPYFGRIRFTRAQKKAWYHEREGVLFGFGVGYFLLAKIPYVGVLVYGIAEASTAFLITKITDPPPVPTASKEFIESQLVWKNKKEFLTMPVHAVDTYGIKTPAPDGPARVVEAMPDKKFS